MFILEELIDKGACDPMVNFFVRTGRRNITPEIINLFRSDMEDSWMLWLLKNIRDEELLCSRMEDRCDEVRIYVAKKIHRSLLSRMRYDGSIEVRCVVARRISDEYFEEMIGDVNDRVVTIVAKRVLESPLRGMDDDDRECIIRYAKYLLLPQEKKQEIAPDVQDIVEKRKIRY